MREAAAWLRATTLDWVDPLSEEGLATMAEPEEVAGNADEEASEQNRLPYSELDDFKAAKVIGRAIFAADLDVTHPLGFG